MSPSPTKPCPKCGADMEFNPADPDYGADADGNRGVFVPADWTCEQCGHQEIELEEDDVIQE